MLEQVDLSKNLSQEEYEHLLPGLQQRFHQLQQTCRERAIASIIVFVELFFRAFLRGGAK
jgi:polyphosphate kinase 2 (PPK2 family)